jgi:hypothetical protein
MTELYHPARPLQLLIYTVVISQAREYNEQMFSTSHLLVKYWRQILCTVVAFFLIISYTYMVVHLKSASERRIQERIDQMEERRKQCELKFPLYADHYKECINSTYMSRAPLEAARPSMLHVKVYVSD